MFGFDSFNNDKKYIFYIEDENTSVHVNNNMEPVLHLFSNGHFMINGRISLARAR